MLIVSNVLHYNYPNPFFVNQKKNPRYFIVEVSLNFVMFFCGFFFCFGIDDTQRQVKYNYVHLYLFKAINGRNKS